MSGLVDYVLHEVSCSAVSGGNRVVVLELPLGVVQHLNDLDGLPVHAVVGHLPFNSLQAFIQVLLAFSVNVLLCSIQACSICSGYGDVASPLVGSLDDVTVAEVAV